MFAKKRLTLAVSTTLVCLSCAAPAGTLSFGGVDVPETDAEKRGVLASDTAWVDGSQYDIGFNTILRSGEGLVKGDKLPFGTLIDKSGEPLVAKDGSWRISSDNDFNSLLNTGYGLFMVSHFESRPAAMYVSKLKQTKDGHLFAKWTKPIDFSGVEGGWVHCAGSVTPWETHLGSEEYEPDARQWTENSISAYNAAMADYYGEGADPLVVMNPYNYGYPVEVEITSQKGDAEVTKHYAMGRVALELAYVMPDQQTAYLTDDGTNTGLFMFVADEPGDLSSGKLYGAKVHQAKQTYGDPVERTPFALEWIYLRRANNTEIAAKIPDTRFEDLFETAAVKPNGKCPKGFTSINSGHGGPYQECLNLKPGKKTAKLASRLETRRYAALKGVTTEFRKMEGITFDPDSGKLYLAMSETARGMEDFKKNGSDNTTYDQGGYNHIRVAYNTCGGVYYMQTGKGILDNRGKKIKSNYVAVNMVPEVFGRMVDNVPLNKCDLAGLANPDNVSFLAGYDALIVGEDTGSGHQNDMIWHYNTYNKSLTRIQTTPYGSETTSPYWYPNINGFGYLMTVIQHPYGESDVIKYLDGVEAGEDTDEVTASNINSIGADRGYSAYIGPFPALTN